MSALDPLKPAPAASADLDDTTLGALKVVLKYAVFACLWILLSDSILGKLVRNPNRMVNLSILKGGLFVVITALLLFVLVRRFGTRLAAREKALLHQQREGLRLEKTLKENDEMFKALAEGSADGFFVHDLDGRFVAANQRASDSLGYSHAELLELGVEDLDADLPIASLRARWAASPAGYSHTTRTHQRRKDGTLLPVEIRSSAFDFHEQRRFLAVVRDLTELERAAQALQHAAGEQLRLEAELEHAQKLESLGSLASGVAHDMNNVLAAIQSVTEVMENSLALDPRAVKGLATIVKATLRGRNLVKAIGDFARKDLQGAEAVDLNRIIQDSAKRLELPPGREVELILDLQEPLPALLGERSPLANAFTHLCGNALDAMPRGGTLAIRTRSLGEAQVELTVTDTGEGMAPEVLARALEPFFTTKPTGKGNGLGLAMVHGIVKAHGGTLQLQSQVGSGTSVRLQLPALPAGSPFLQEAAAPAGAQRNLKVLLVDDDELIRDAVPPMLEVFGHSTVTAPSARAALALLETGLEVDLAILDLNMPELGGAKALAPLRALRPQLPVLIATGFLDAATEEFLRGLSQVQTLSKPFTMDELEAKLRVLCP